MIASVYEAPTDVAGYDPTRDADGYWFDADEAVRRIKVINHVANRWTLEKWQEAIVATLFGWKRPDGTRRYREAFIFVPRKNGKTNLAAALAVSSFFCEDEPLRQYFCAAGDLDQANLVFSVIVWMIENSPVIKKKCKITRARKWITFGSSYLRAIPADAKGAYGTEPHFAVGDELHTWPDRLLKDAIHTGTGSRPEPLEVYITTAGYDTQTICGEVYNHACQVRDGIVSDQSFLPVIYEAGKEDDWRLESTWKKANPNYGISIRSDYLADECKKAIDSPVYENTFRREHLNQWTEQKTRWLKMDDWKACPATDEPIPDGAEVCLGMDLSTTTDLSAICICQRLGDGKYKAEWKFYIAEERAKYIEAQDRVPYYLWVRQGFVTATPGREIDYSFIENDIDELTRQYEVRLLGFDPYNARDLVQRLINVHGVNCIKLPQGVATLSAPSKELERLVIGHHLDHGNNPVAEWNARNCEIVLDNNGNYKLTKENNRGAKKIDGIAALIFALSVWSTIPELGECLYAQPGNLIL